MAAWIGVMKGVFWAISGRQAMAGRTVGLSGLPGMRQLGEG